MELNFIWCLFLSKHKIWPTCTGTCVRTYFRPFVVGFKKFQNYFLFNQVPDKKFPEPEPPQNRPAPKPWWGTGGKALRGGAESPMRGDRPSRPSPCLRKCVPLIFLCSLGFFLVLINRGRFINKNFVFRVPRLRTSWGSVGGVWRRRRKRRQPSGPASSCWR